MLERLREMEKDYIDFHETGVHKIIKRVMLPVMSLLPVAILQKSTQVETSVAASWSPMVAGDNYNLLGNEVANIWPFVGNTIEGMGKPKTHLKNFTHQKYLQYQEYNIYIYIIYLLQFQQW